MHSFSAWLGRISYGAHIISDNHCCVLATVQRIYSKILWFYHRSGMFVHKCWSLAAAFTTLHLRSGKHLFDIHKWDSWLWIRDADGIQVNRTHAHAERHSYACQCTYSTVCQLAAQSTKHTHTHMNFQLTGFVRFSFNDITSEPVSTG